MVKRAVYEDGAHEQDKGFALESALFGLCFTTADQKAGMRAFSRSGRWSTPVNKRCEVRLSEAP